MPADFCGMHYKSTIDLTQGQHLNTHDMAGVQPYDINTADGTFNWTALDAFIATWGSRPWTYCMWGTPVWASARPSETSTASSRVGAFAEWANPAKAAALATALVSRYPTLTHVELCNEADIPSPGYWFSGTVTAYITQAQAVYNAVKAARSSVVVLGPSVVSYAANPAWLASFYSGGGDAYIDGISYHGYQGQFATPYKALLGQFFNLRYIRQARSVAGLSAKPIYCSEMGQTNPLPGTQSDAALFAGYARAMIVGAASGAKHANWYIYDDTTFGYSTRPAVVASIAAFVTLLCGSTLSAVTMSTDDSSVSCTIGSTAYTF